MFFFVSQSLSLSLLFFFISSSAMSRSRRGSWTEGPTIGDKRFWPRNREWLAISSQLLRKLTVGLIGSVGRWESAGSLRMGESWGLMKRFCSGNCDWLREAHYRLSRPIDFGIPVFRYNRYSVRDRECKMASRRYSVRDRDNQKYVGSRPEASPTWYPIFGFLGYGGR
jgi:hypothetical protein